MAPAKSGDTCRCGHNAILQVDCTAFKSSPHAYPPSIKLESILFGSSELNVVFQADPARPDQPLNFALLLSPCLSLSIRFGTNLAMGQRD